MSRFWMTCALVLVAAPVGCEAMQNVGDWIQQPDQAQVVEGAVQDAVSGNWGGLIMKIALLGGGAVAVLLGVKKVTKKKVAA